MGMLTSQPTTPSESGSEGIGGLVFIRNASLYLRPLADQRVNPDRAPAQVVKLVDTLL